MAANSNSVGKIAYFGKRIVCLNLNHLPPHSYSLSPSALCFRRGDHSSAYDKNLEEQICPTVVPDHMIQPISENYWAPNPQTGIFGPPTQPTSKPEAHVLPTATADKDGSVLELKAWFRHTGLEDLEKPHLL